MKLLKALFYSFPFQLLLLHLRKNLVLLLFWVLLVAVITGAIAGGFGGYHLFLNPEYLGTINFWGFFFQGMAFGLFIMTWNITTYILHSHRFPFLATLHRPFFVYCLNNAVIPIAVGLFYTYRMTLYQRENQFEMPESIFFYVEGFLVGLALSIFLITMYFNFTNKNILSFNKGKFKVKKKQPRSRAGGVKKNVEWSSRVQINKDLAPVDYYLNYRLKPKIARPVHHYDDSLIKAVQSQHHNNALFIQIGSLILLMLSGLLIEIPMFSLPAAASLTLVITTLVALAGSFNFWLREWSTPALILIMIMLNLATSYDLINYKNKAYGLDYEGHTSPYSVEHMTALSSDSIIQQDKEHTLQMLENWKQKVQKLNGIDKPPIVFLNFSGGGSTAFSWSLRTMQVADSLFRGSLMDHAILVSGASGGMLGAAYFRELYHKKQRGEAIDLQDSKYWWKASDDLLNPIAGSIPTNDLFYPTQSFEVNGHRYRKDRAYYFERAYNETTDFVLDQPLSYYAQPEFDGIIPMMVVSPTVVDDSRRLIIAAQPSSYLTRPASEYKSSIPGLEVDGLEFSRYFEKQGAEQLKMTSALRMSATYPYILPNVYMPTKPPIQIMDAGFRDNLGFETALRFMQCFRSWLVENTDRIILVNVRAFVKVEEIKTENYYESFFSKLINPLMGFVGMVGQLQDFQEDYETTLLNELLDDKLSVISLQYVPNKFAQDPSMSFHLTTAEKLDIKNAIDLPVNQKQLKRLGALLHKATSPFIGSQ